MSETNTKVDPTGGARVAKAKGNTSVGMIAMYAGAISGGIECVAVWPMEYIKTQLQLQKAPKAGEKLPFTGMIGGLRYTVRTSGFFSLYKGLDVTLLGAVPKAGIRFGGNKYCKELLKDPVTGKLNAGQQFLAGIGAGTCEAILAVTPMETIKTKLIESNTNFTQGVKLILKESGPAGLYQGLSATILKQSTNQGFRFMAFNAYKDFMTTDGKKLQPLQNLLGGMMAGCFSSCMNNPFDVIKTQMQGLQAKQYKNTVDCFKQILASEGIKGFYRGLLPRLGRVVPGQGVIFMSYEFIEGKLTEILG